MQSLILSRGNNPIKTLSVCLMFVDRENKETTVRTFRLIKEWDDILTEDAQKQSISTSALLNQIVEKYIIFERFIDSIEGVTIEASTLSEFLEKLTENEIEEIGSKVGTRSLRNELFIRGLKQDFESVKFLIEFIYDKYGGWFNSNFYSNKDDNVIFLRYRLGKKWGHFLKGFFYDVFNEALGIDVEITLFNDSMSINMPLRKARKR